MRNPDPSVRQAGCRVKRRRIIYAYCCAIIAGLIIFDIMTVGMILVFSLTSGAIPFSVENSSDGILFTIVIVPFSLLFQFPIAAVGALPFAAFFFAKIDIYWRASRRAFILYGSICPGLAMLVLVFFFMNPSGELLNNTGHWPMDYWPFGKGKTGDGIVDYLLSTLTLAIMAIPGGGIAGYVFWRLTFGRSILNQRGIEVVS